MPSGEYIYIKTLGFEQATNIKDQAVLAAEEMHVSGIIMVKNSLGLLEAAQTVGDYKKVTSVNLEVANAKLITVLNYKRSTSVQSARMSASNQDRADFAGQLGSLFGGGVAIFNDPFKIEFLGGAGFSGGTQEQDEKIGRTAIWKAGFYSDLGIPLAIGPKREVELEFDSSKTRVCLACDSIDASVGFTGVTEADQADVLVKMIRQYKLFVGSPYDYILSESEQLQQEQDAEYVFEAPRAVTIAACSWHFRNLESLYSNIFGYYQVIPEMLEEAAK